MQLLLDSQHVLLGGERKDTEWRRGGKSASSALLPVGSDDSPDAGATVLPSVRYLGVSQLAVWCGHPQHRGGGTVLHRHRYDRDSRQDTVVHDHDHGPVNNSVPVLTLWRSLLPYEYRGTANKHSLCHTRLSRYLQFLTSGHSGTSRFLIQAYDFL